MRNLFYVFILIVLVSCKTDNTNKMVEVDSKNSDTSQQIDVSVAVLKQQDFQKQIISNGIIEPQNRSELKFNTSGQIRRIYVRNGQKVPKGALIAELDNELQKNELKKAQINFETAKNKLEEERINYSYSSTADTEIDSVVLQSLYIRTGYLEAKNNVENARIVLSQTRLNAPFSGTVASLTDKQGSYPSQTDPFCILVSQSKMDVVFSVLENELNSLNTGQEVVVKPFADNKSEYSGKITEINPLVNDKGMVRLKAKIDNPGKQLFDGMNVKVFINKTINELIVVPKEALVLRSNREVVFTVTNGRSRWNYVEILEENSSSYGLKDGLKVGDTVIVSNNMNLSHDIEVSTRFAEESNKD